MQDNEGGKKFVEAFVFISDERLIRRPFLVEEISLIEADKRWKVKGDKTNCNHGKHSTRENRWSAEIVRFRRLDRAERGYNGAGAKGGKSCYHYQARETCDRYHTHENM